MEKKLYKDPGNKLLMGVCSGLAKYLGIDATILRLLWVLVTIMACIPGIIAYVAAALIIPEDPAEAADGENRAE